MWPRSRILVLRKRSRWIDENIAFIKQVETTLERIDLNLHPPIN